jgi:hypothetical protein
MACKVGHQPEPPWATCRCKPPRCSPHKGRLRASGDFESRIEIYTRKPGQIGYVYIFATETGAIKVGFTKCVVSRLSALCSIYGALRLERAIGTSVATARKIEKALHNRLARWNGSEWYNAPIFLANAILDEEIKSRAWLRLTFGSPHKSD